MNSTNSCVSAMTDVGRVALPYVAGTLMSLAIIVGFILNATIVFLILKYKNSMIRIQADVLILNIAITDLITLLGCTAQIFVPAEYWCGKPASSKFGLSVNNITPLTIAESFRSLGVPASNYAMAWLSVERYRVIVLLHRYSGHTRCLKRSWPLLCIYAIAIVNVGTHYLLPDEQHANFHDYFSVIIVFLLPLSVTIIMYCTIATILWRQRAFDNGQTNRLLNYKKTALLIILYVLIIALCNIPYCVYVVLDGYPNDSLDNFMSPTSFAYFSFFAFWLITVIPKLCNAMLLFILSSRLRKCWQELLQRITCK